MVQRYIEQLALLIEGTCLPGDAKVEYKHFFSGAASYIDNVMFASLTPVGLALKLPDKYRVDLLQQGVAPLRYFPKAPIKKSTWC